MTTAARKRSGGKAKASSAAVPRRKKGEGDVEYHDRLAQLAHEATLAGDDAGASKLQRKAGDLARLSEDVARRPRKKGLRGPGTYPWNQCIKDQMKRGQPQDVAAKICGRIRASSRSKYPVYWQARGSNPESDAHYEGEPMRDDGHGVALVLAPGDVAEVSHHMMVLVRTNGEVVATVHPVDDEAMAIVEERFPRYAMIGPLHVTNSQWRAFARLDLER